MKVLFVAPRIPFPIDTGAKIRTYNIIRHLSKCHDVTVLSFAEDQVEVTNFKNALKNINVVAIEKDDKFARKAMYFIRSFFTSLPYVVNKYTSFRMSDAVKMIIEKNRFDIVHFDHIHMAQYIPSRETIPSVLDQHNVEYVIAERYAEKEKFFLKRWFIRWQAYKMKAYERKMIGKFKSVTAVSDLDRELFKQLDPKANIVTSPNGVSNESFEFHINNPITKTLGFIGSLDWWPNVDGMLWFVDEIYPKLKKEMPEIKIMVVGRNPDKNIKQCVEGKDIFVYENVPDIQPYYRQSDLLLVPLRIGGGTRIKILEAMASGCPVVSTRIGAEGIEATDNNEILYAETPAEFVEKIKNVLSDRELYEKICKLGRKLVEQKYDWSNTAGIISKEYMNRRGSDLEM